MFPGEERTLIFVKEKILQRHIKYFTAEYLRALDKQLIKTTNNIHQILLIVFKEQNHYNI